MHMQHAHAHAHATCACNMHMRMQMDMQHAHAHADGHEHAHAHADSRCRCSMYTHTHMHTRHTMPHRMAGLQKRRRRRALDSGGSPFDRRARPFAAAHRTRLWTDARDTTYVLTSCELQ